jgi:outer membrane receptor protein involved in Fe transport
VFTAALFGIDVPSQIDPETLWSYEIGNKTTFLDGRLTVETALYYNDWKDLQVTIVAGGALGALVNAGKAHAFGADLAVTYRPVTGLSLSLSGNVNESKLDSTVPTAFNKGDRIVNVPRYTVNASASYTTPITDSLDFFGFAELQQGDRRFLSAQGLSGKSDPQSILNARIGIEGKSWGAYLTATNLLDERGFTYPPLSTTNFEGSIPRPRTIGILLRANY